MKSLALFVLRTTFGGLQAGHGAQKAFGAFGGPGFEGTTGWLASMGIQPAQPAAAAAVASELGGGVLTTAGFLYPIGPLLTLGSMAVATIKVHNLHKGHPIWVTENGAELPVLNMAVAISLALAGPGNISLDKLFGTELPRWTVFPGLAIAAAAIAYTLRDEIAAMQQQGGPQEISSQDSTQIKQGTEAAPTA